MRRRTIQRTLVLQGDLGLTERFALRLVAPLRDIATSGMFTFDSAGAGDLEAWGRWGLGPELGSSGSVVGAGIALPTGRDPDAALTGENIAFGAGDASLLLSAEGFRRLGSALTIFGLARYRRPLGSAPGGYLFGDDAGWSGFARWQPGGRRLSFSLGVTGQHLGRDEIGGLAADNRGGRSHHAGAGVSVPAGAGGALGFLVQRQVERSVRGDQLLAPWSFIAAYSFSWGKHIHDDHEPHS